MNLDEQDAQTISSYIMASRPDYKGPVFVDLSRLEEIYSKRIARTVLTK